MRTKHGIMAAIAAFAATVAAVPLSVYAALPDGYAQLDWVESDGTAYINTGVVPTQTMEFTFKFQPETQQAWKGAFGSYVDESSLTTRIIFSNTSSTSFRVYHLSRASSGGVIFDNVVSGLGQPIEGYFNHSYARLNNVEHSLSAVTGTATSAPMKLGRSAGAGTSRQKIFYFKITEGSTLLRDFVPARRKSDSAIGFYDQANSVFYGKAEASGAFTAGPSLDGKLIVSGEPVAYGIPSPGYGTHDDIGAGDSFDVSCPAAYTNYTTATIWYCTGWTLYDVDDTVISSGAGNSFAYTHPNPAAYRRLEWHWETDAGATAASERAFVFVNKGTSSYWHTATNCVLALPVEFPDGASSATLAVSGRKYSTSYANITTSQFTLTLPAATSTETENVYDLTLTFDDSGATTRTARLGLIRGYDTTTMGSTRCLASITQRNWSHVNGHRAVFPIPYGMTDFAVGGVVTDTGLDGDQGWCAIDVPSGQTIPLTLDELAAALFGVSLGTFIIVF